MAQENQANRSFLYRLLHDRTANTLAIAAASLMPLLAMVGGGIDASRYYMAAARMQAACDAGALAARQAMGPNSWNDTYRQTGLTFFDQNFSNGIFGTTNRTRNYSANNSGVVTGTASATIPTTIMGAFGYTSFQLSATCSAEVNISNSDIMFVLDVTGSMADCPDNSNCGSGPGSKIVALRSAVMSFYDTVEAASSPAAQVRFGVVPYSQQVNVGFSIPRQYMANNHTYQSRVARYNNALCQGSSVGAPCEYSNQTEWITRLTSNLGSGTQSLYYYNNNATNASTADSADQTRCLTTNRGTFSVGSETWEISNTQYVLNQYPSAPTATRAGCRGTVRKLRPATVADVTPPFRDWVYCPVTTGTTAPCGVTNPANSPAGWESVNFSTIYSGNNINMPIGTNGAMTNVTWGGCIEEAETVRTDTYNPLPSGAFDVNINLVPSTEAQRWHPALINAVWKREDSGGNQINWLYQTGDESRPGWACPRAAIKLSEIQRTDLQNYVNALAAGGNTYHDIGMTWGARFISPRGIFASENATAPNGDPIARHIVFMTDGAQVNNVENYSTQGVEWWDRRITSDGNGTSEFNRRASRLQAVCRAAQAENITVWVVAFGTTLTQNLIDCASPGRAFQAADSATLNARFQEIAQKIAQLRLTQ